MKSYFTNEQIEEFEKILAEYKDKGSIIAYGGGYDRKGGCLVIAQKAVELAKKPNPKMLFLPTAHKDKLDEHEEMIEAFESIGIQTDVLFVSQASNEEIKSKIASADIIYETGGNLDFLTREWQARGVNEEIRKAFDRGAVLAGVSSGAMCWGERGYDDFGEPVWRLTSSFPFFGKRAAYDFRLASDVLPFCICSHFDNVAWHTYAFKAKKLDIPSLCIDNSACVIFHEGKFEVMNEMLGRSAYIYYPELGIKKVNVKKHPELLGYILAYRLRNKKQVCRLKCALPK